MTTNLPAWIVTQLSEWLEGVSRKDLSKRAFSISETYRAGGDSSRIDQALDAVAYAAVRMPATYAAVRAALSHVAEAVPGFAPCSLLDIGAGPGTATWASLDVWSSLKHAQLLDSNRQLLDRARELAVCSPQNEIRFDFANVSLSHGLREMSKSDLVIVSYALTEIPMKAALEALQELWRHSEEMFVIVEPGTPDGFSRILTYRSVLIEEGGHIVAPCTHQLDCPLANAERWCHFSQRLARARAHLAIKGATVPFEDEKYCYLAATRSSLPPPCARRVLATPKVNKAQVSLTCCAPNTVEEKLVPRKSAEAYRLAKRAKWGDAIEL